MGRGVDSFREGPLGLMKIDISVGGRIWVFM